MANLSGAFVLYHAKVQAVKSMLLGLYTEDTAIFSEIAFYNDSAELLPRIITNCTNHFKILFYLVNTESIQTFKVNQ